MIPNFEVDDIKVRSTWESNLCYQSTVSYTDGLAAQATKMILKEARNWGTHARLAQSVERWTLNPTVVGSSPTLGEYFIILIAHSFVHNHVTNNHLVQSPWMANRNELEHFWINLHSDWQTPIGTFICDSFQLSLFRLIPNDSNLFRRVR